MGFAPTWLRQVSPPPLLHKTTLTTDLWPSWSKMRKCGRKCFAQIWSFYEFPSGVIAPNRTDRQTDRRTGQHFPSYRTCCPITRSLKTRLSKHWTECYSEIRASRVASFLYLYSFFQVKSDVSQYRTSSQIFKNMSGHCWKSIRRPGYLICSKTSDGLRLFSADSRKS